MASQMTTRIAFLLLLSYVSGEQLRGLTEREDRVNIQDGETKKIFNRAKRAGDVVLNLNQTGALECYTCQDADKIDSTTCDTSSAAKTCKSDEVCYIRRDESLFHGKLNFTKGCGPPCGNNYCMVSQDYRICIECCDDSSLCNIGYPPGSGCIAFPCIFGDCVQLPTSFTCICRQGFKGDDCSDVDACDEFPCQHNGTCSGTLRDEYVCSCQNQAFSPSQTEKEGCLCVRFTVPDYKCHCEARYTGKNCTDDLCSNVTCENGGMCDFVGDRPVCVCPANTTGEHCESIVDACTNMTCENGGICNFVGGKPVCVCPANATGEHCRSIIETSCPGDYMIVSGARHQDLNGWYKKGTATCYGKPTYSTYSVEYQKTLYLYASYTPQGGAEWSISDVFCSNTVSAFVLDGAPTPDKITGFWNEYSATASFISNPNIRITCGESEDGTFSGEEVTVTASTVLLVLTALLSPICMSTS